MQYIKSTRIYFYEDLEPIKITDQCNDTRAKSHGSLETLSANILEEYKKIKNKLYNTPIRQ